MTSTPTKQKPCGARTRTGDSCKQPALENGRCRFHGGKTPKGIDSANFRHGRYSHYLPARLKQRYEEACQDDRLLEMRDEISLLDTRITELISGMDTGESGRIWRDLKNARKQLLYAKQVDDQSGMTQALNSIVILIQNGARDWEAWAEITTTIEQRRRVVESERKRLLEMQQYITAEKAMLLIYAVAEILKRHIPDRQLLDQISGEIGRLINPDAGQIAEIDPGE
jgi:hypothetical protein